MNGYFDNAATTRPTREVIQDVMYAMEKFWYNPSAQYEKAREVKHMIAHAREQVATYFNCYPEEIFFTSCGSESNNWVLKGYKALHPFNKIFVGATEHSSIISPKYYLNPRYTILPVDHYGRLDTNNIKEFLQTDDLLSVMYANNETGNINDIKKIAVMVHNRGGKIHTDATQAISHVKIDIKDLDIDFLSASGHKFGLPRGIGLLYKKEGVKLDPLIYGGGQEGDQRAGTENTALIYALGNQLERLSKIEKKIQDGQRWKKKEFMRKLTIDMVNLDVSIRYNNDSIMCLPNIISVTLPSINANDLLTLLDLDGIKCSAGSACSSESTEPSHVLTAMHLTDEEAHDTIRISMGYRTRSSDLDGLEHSIVKCVKRLQADKA